MVDQRPRRLETSIVDNVANGRNAGIGSPRADRIRRTIDEHPTLTDEQTHMVEALTSDGHRIDAVIGVAGSGKTFALGVANDIWTEAATSRSDSHSQARQPVAFKQGPESHRPRSTSCSTNWTVPNIRDCPTERCSSSMKPAWFPRASSQHCSTTCAPTPRSYSSATITSSQRSERAECCAASPSDSTTSRRSPRTDVNNTSPSAKR